MFQGVRSQVAVSRSAIGCIKRTIFHLKVTTSNPPQVLRRIPLGRFAECEECCVGGLFPAERCRGDPEWIGSSDRWRLSATLLVQKTMRKIELARSCFPMFLILSNYKVAIQEVERVTQAHRDYLDQAYRAGKLLISGPRIPRTGGVTIACVKTRGEVDELIERDPFHKQGIADYEVFEFKATKYQPVLSSIVRESEPPS